MGAWARLEEGLHLRFEWDGLSDGLLEISISGVLDVPIRVLASVLC